MRAKGVFSKIFIVISIVIMCSFIMPIRSHAIDSKLGKPFAAFITVVGDAIENGLQTFFIGDKAVTEKNKKESKLNIKYSVLNIVSNKIAILDINFFKNGSSTETEVKDEYIQNRVDAYNNAKNNTIKVLNEYNDQYINGQDINYTKLETDLKGAITSETEDGYTLTVAIKNLVEETEYNDKYDFDVIWAEKNNSSDYYESDFNFITSNMANNITDIVNIDNLQDSEQYSKCAKFYTSDYLNYSTDTSTGMFNISAWESAFEEFGTVLNQIDANSVTTETRESSADILKPIVQKWYYMFRNIALVALLSILVYLGIKIVLSTTANDTAKYKKLLSSWFMAIVILFILHFIMAFTLNIIDEINNVIVKSITDADSLAGTEIGTDSLMEDIRKRAEEDSGTYSGNQMMTYALLYVVLVIYCVKFTWIYVKRVLYLTFLTIIAPLIAVTYPLDKEKDGVAQAFGYWTREYFFNALMQPLHLLVYYVFVSLATEIVTENCVYAIIVIAFISHAEKLIRSMFKLDKAGGASSLSSFTEGALVSGAVSKLSGGSKLFGPASKSNEDTTGENGENNNGIKMASLDDVFSDESTPGIKQDININQGNSGLENSGLSDSGQAWMDYINDQEEQTKMDIPKLNFANNTGSSASTINIPNISSGTTQFKMPSSQELREMGMTAQEYRDKMEKSIRDGNVGQSWADYINNQEEQAKADIPKIKFENNIGNNASAQPSNNRSNATALNNNIKNINVNKEKKVQLSVARGALNVAKYTGGKVFNKNTIRTAAGIATGAVGVTAGLAAGIASGDLKKTAEYAVAGAAAGKAVGNIGYDAGGKVVQTAKATVDNVSDTFMEGYYGDEKTYQQEYEIPKIKEKNSKDKKVKEKYKNAGFEDWKKAMDSSARDKLYKTGKITDEDKIIKALKVKEKNGLSDEDTVKYAVAASQIKTYKDIKYVESEIKGKLLDKGMDIEQANKETKEKMKNIKDIAGI